MVDREQTQFEEPCAGTRAGGIRHERHPSGITLLKAIDQSLYPSALTLPIRVPRMKRVADATRRNCALGARFAEGGMRIDFVISTQEWR
jgi:hypothetical protein